MRSSGVRDSRFCRRPQPLLELTFTARRAAKIFAGAENTTIFWQRWATTPTTPFNARQVLLLNRLLDGFEGKLTSSNWAAIAEYSPDTALRDLNGACCGNWMRVGVVLGMG
jgi:hypothetical protein